MSYKEINLALTDDHKMLKEAVREFAINVLRPASLKLDKLPASEVIKKDSLFFDVLKQAYEMDYHTAMLPEEMGGAGLDPLSQHIFWEEMGYGSAGLSIAIGASGFAPLAVAMLGGSEHLVNKFVKPFVDCKDGSISSCWAITEPNHGSDNLSVGTEQFRNPKITQQVRAVKKGNEWIINGQKSAWISSGPVATNAVLFLGIDASHGMAGGGVALIDLEQSGVTKGAALDKMGLRDEPQGELFFDNAVVPETDMVVLPEAYEHVVREVLTLANGAVMAPVFTGVAQAAYDLALQHCTERVVGGKLLCEHQATQKRLFEMFMKIETARAYSRTAMFYNMASGTPDIKYAIAAKVFCTNTAFEVANEAAQLFGGYGVSKEYPIEKILRDARASQIADGTNCNLSLVAGNHIVKEAMS